MGTVHGYDGYGGTVDEYCTWVRWHGTWARYMGTVHRYGARTQTYTQHPYPHPTTVPNTNSRNRTQQYQHTYLYPTPAPNTRTQHPYPYPTPVPTSVPVPVPIEITPRTLRNRLNREAWFHCFQKLIIYTYDADFFLMDVQCGPPKRDVNVGLDSPLQNTIVICVP